jgi:hypothetical protein
VRPHVCTYVLDPKGRGARPSVFKKRYPASRVLWVGADAEKTTNTIDIE